MWQSWGFHVSYNEYPFSSLFQNFMFTFSCSHAPLKLQILHVSFTREVPLVS